MKAVFSATPCCSAIFARRCCLAWWRRGRADKRLRIWSAACAAGQEAYSIAILLSEMGLTRQGWNIDLIATDLSGEAIARAEAGRYAACEIERGLDAHAMRYFRRDGAEWLVDAALRRMVTFRRFNLLDSFGWLDDLDMVFCRNVLMYFDHRHAAGCAGPHRRHHGAGRLADCGRE